MNRRLSARFQVELECAWTSARTGQPVYASTLNLGSGGALLRVDHRLSPEELPAVGNTLTLHLALPANPSFRRRCLIAGASVLRIEQDAVGVTRLALSFDRKRFGEWPFKVVVQPQAVSELPVLLM